MLSRSLTKIAAARFLWRFALVFGLVYVVWWGASACNQNATHTLVASPGQTSVPVYPADQIFRQATGENGTGAANQQQKFFPKMVSTNPHVRIISRNKSDVRIKILDGPDYGQIGYVAPQNVS